MNPKLRKSLTRFRCVSHKLYIETGRHGNSKRERQERICMYCNLNDIEDEYHFLLVCPLYKEDRKLYKNISGIIQVYINVSHYCLVKISMLLEIWLNIFKVPCI